MKKSKSIYQTVIDGEWMHLPRVGVLHACCDCGLVHDLIPKIDERGRLWLKVTRHERATAGIRRGKGMRSVAKIVGKKVKNRDAV